MLRLGVGVARKILKGADPRRTQAHADEPRQVKLEARLLRRRCEKISVRAWNSATKRSKNSRANLVGFFWPMAGPSAATMAERSAPSNSMAGIVASSTPLPAPFQPAWAAPITRALGSAKGSCRSQRQ